MKNGLQSRLPGLVTNAFSPTHEKSVWKFFENKKVLRDAVDTSHV